MSDSPFHPPEDVGEPPKSGSWVHLATRIAVAGSILAYSALLAVPGGLIGTAIFLFGAVDDEIPVDEFFQLATVVVLFFSVCVVGLVCAGVLVVFRKLAQAATLAFAGYAMTAALFLALFRVVSGESLREGASIIAVGSLAPMFFVMAYGVLRIVSNRDAA